jgi:hypothetical protein
MFEYEGMTVLAVTLLSEEFAKFDLATNWLARIRDPHGRNWSKDAQTALPDLNT